MHVFIIRDSKLIISVIKKRSHKVFVIRFLFTRYGLVHDKRILVEFKILFGYKHKIEMKTNSLVRFVFMIHLLFIYDYFYVHSQN